MNFGKGTKFKIVLFFLAVLNDFCGGNDIVYIRTHSLVHTFSPTIVLSLTHVVRPVFSSAKVSFVYMQMHSHTSVHVHFGLNEKVVVLAALSHSQ